MKKTQRNTAQVSGVHLRPTECRTEEDIADAAFDGLRRRPIVAVKSDGTQVVCCRSTARRHGWKVQDKLFDPAINSPRTRKGKAKRPQAPAQAPSVAQVVARTVQRATDAAGSARAQGGGGSPAARTLKRAARTASLETLLGATLLSDRRGTVRAVGEVVLEAAKAAGLDIHTPVEDVAKAA